MKLVNSGVPSTKSAGTPGAKAETKEIPDGRCDARKCDLEQPQLDDRAFVPVAAGPGAASDGEGRQRSAVARQAWSGADGRRAVPVDRDQRGARRHSCVSSDVVAALRAVRRPVPLYADVQSLRGGGGRPLWSNSRRMAGGKTDSSLRTLDAGGDGGLAASLTGFQRSNVPPFHRSKVQGT